MRDKMASGIFACSISIFVQRKEKILWVKRNLEKNHVRKCSENFLKEENRK